MATLCKTTVLKVYLDVIEDVISGVRELFIEDGVDEQVLQELKLSWEAKLRATKAVDNQSDVDKQGIKKLSEVSMTNGFPKQQQQQTLPQQQQQQQQQQSQQQQQQHQQQQVVKQVVGQVPPNNHVQTQSVAQILEAKMVPIQITLPVQPGTDASPRVLTIQVPASALQGNQLHKVLTGPVITATMSLPQPIASQMLQQHVNAAFNQPQQQINVRQINKTVIQSDGMHMPDSSDDEAKPSSSRISCLEIKKKPTRYYAKQSDGPMDSSDEDEDGSEEDDGSDEADDDKDEDEQEVDEGGPEEEPLNSEDDVTDEDPSDLFDTENVVVCQYDKITRSRNKWKFHLKDGIMNLNGEDYLFQKASGDAEW